jgi:thiaminase/transcriptional activator TenA
MTSKYDPLSDPPLNQLPIDLWQQSQDVVQRCLEHSFIREMACGNLSRHIYDRYVAQDVIFLRTYVTALSVGINHCLQSAKLTEFLSAALHEAVLELDMKQIEAKNRAIPDYYFRALSATTDFGNFLIRAAQTHEISILMAATLPCVQLYSYLGQELSRNLSNGVPHPYEAWISNNAGWSTKRIATEWESRFSEFVSDTPEVRKTYRMALEHELKFFNASYYGK